MPKSSIAFGYDKTTWETTTRSHLRLTENSVRDYGDTDKFRAAVNPETRSVHWNFGTTKTDYSTSNKLPNPMLTSHKPAKLDKDQEKQLRSSHFILGSDTIDYHWKHGVDQKKLLEATKKQFDTNADVRSKQMKPRNQNVNFGNDKVDYRSEATSSFPDHGFENNMEDRERTRLFVEKLKQSGVTLGSHQSDYSTTNHHTPHHNAERARPIINPSKSSVVFGYHQNSYDTESGQAYLIADNQSQTGGYLATLKKMSTNS